MNKTVIFVVVILTAIAVGLYGLVYWVDAPAVQQTGDGVRFGFIRAVNEKDGAHTIAFDEAQWFVGEDAKNAAIAAGQCTEATRDECVPNDFFILNESTTTIELPLTLDPTISMATLNAEEEGVRETPIDLNGFKALINDSAQRWAKLPYQMFVENGIVTIIEEVYVP